MTKKVKLIYGEAGGELIINREIMEYLLKEYVPLKCRDVYVKIRKWKREVNKPFPFRGEDGILAEEILDGEKEGITYIEICVNIDVNKNDRKTL